MDNSPGFKATWFESAARHQTEGWHLDFKQKIYRFENEEVEFKFIRLLIALSNVARRVGRPSRIMFGVDDLDRSFHDVREQYAGDKEPGWWNAPNSSIHKRQKDGVEEVFRTIADKWIAPITPEFQLEYGLVEGQFVSYLEIRPMPTSRPFALKRARSKDNIYSVGTVFIRSNSSSVPLAPAEVDKLLTISESEYLDRQNWAELVREHTFGYFEEANSLTVQFQPSVRGQAVGAVDAVLQALAAGEHVTLLLGNAGEGKTVLLHDIAYELARKHNLEWLTRRAQFGQDEDIDRDETTVISSVADELEVVPTLPVPVYFPLRITFDTVDDFKAHLAHKIGQLTGRSDLRQVDRLFNIQGSRWIILLDGVDEIRNRREAGPKLRSWVEALPPNVQVVIAARPYAAPLTTGRLITLAELTSDETMQILKTKLQRADPESGTDRAERVEQWLRQNPDVLSIMRRQRAIDGLINLVSGSTPQLTEIDQEKVVLVERASVTSQAANDNSIPVIASDVFLDSETNEGGADTLPDASVENDYWDLPQLGQAIRSIIDYLRWEEAKRQQDWGDDTRRALDAATHDLGRTAWHTDWSTTVFDGWQCEEAGWLRRETLYWNQDIGFVQSDQSPLWRFFCYVFRCYAVAEYAFWLKPDDVRNEISTRGLGEGHIIVRLLNDMLAANGRSSLTL